MRESQRETARWLCPSSAPLRLAVGSKALHVEVNKDHPMRTAEAIYAKLPRTREAAISAHAWLSLKSKQGNEPESAQGGKGRFSGCQDHRPLA